MTAYFYPLAVRDRRPHVGAYQHTEGTIWVYGNTRGREAVRVLLAGFDRLAPAVVDAMARAVVHLIAPTVVGVELVRRETDQRTAHYLAELLECETSVQRVRVDRVT